MHVRRSTVAASAALAAMSILVLAPVVALGVSTTPVATLGAGEETSILVTGPRDWRPEPGYAVEIGDRSWTIDVMSVGGVVSVTLADPEPVTVRDLRDCAVVIRFTVQPGSDHVVIFDPDGSARHVEDEGGLDAGGELGPGGPLVCTDPPDTATDPGVMQSAPPTVVLIIAMMAGLILALRRLSRAG